MLILYHKEFAMVVLVLPAAPGRARDTPYRHRDKVMPAERFELPTGKCPRAAYAIAQNDSTHAWLTENK
jgi:hypothetical protein